MEENINSSVNSLFEPYEQDEMLELSNVEYNAINHEMLSDINNLYSDSEEINTGFCSKTEYILESELGKFWEQNYTMSSIYKIMHVNSRSIKKHFNEIEYLVYQNNSHKPHFVCITETWLNKTNESIFKLEGYNFVSQCRNSKKPGGVGYYIYYIDANLEIVKRTDLSLSTNSIECLIIEVKLNGKSNMLIGVVYRPPNGELKTFNDEISKLLKLIDCKNYKVSCLAGDFNIDLLKCQNHDQYRVFLDNMLIGSFFRLYVSQLECLTVLQP